MLLRGGLVMKPTRQRPADAGRAAISLYCRYRHQADEAPEAVLKTHDVRSSPAGRFRALPAMPEAACTCVHQAVALPDEPEAACKHCPQHCYHPTSGQIREVMKFSGRKLLLAGRLDYLIPFAVLSDCGGGFPNLGIAGPSSSSSLAIRRSAAGTRVDL